MVIGFETSVISIGELSIKLYQVPEYGKPVGTDAVLTLKLANTKTSLSCELLNAGFDIFIVCNKEDTFVIVSAPKKTGSVVFIVIIFDQSV